MINDLIQDDGRAQLFVDVKGLKVLYYFSYDSEAGYTRFLVRQRIDGGGKAMNLLRAYYDVCLAEYNPGEGLRYGKGTLTYETEIGKAPNFRVASFMIEDDLERLRRHVEELT